MSPEACTSLHQLEVQLSRLRPQDLPETGILPNGLMSAPPALIEAAEAALAASSQRTLTVAHAGAAYVIKRIAQRPRAIGQSLALCWLVRRVSGHALPMRTLRLSSAMSSVGFEALRLAALARAGVRVPRVVHQGAGYLLLQHCGPTVATLLSGWTVDACRQELPRFAEQLGAFHRTGQWHGAAQIKNLTRSGGLDYRIDFEEDMGELLPLAAVQAFDLVLFLNSISLRGPIDEAEARRLLPVLLHAYLVSNPDRQVAQTLARALPWARAVALLAVPFMRLQVWGRRRNGVARLAVLVKVLADGLRPNPTALESSRPPVGSGPFG